MLKISLLLRKIQTLRVNKNAKFPGYYFYMNLNMWGDLLEVKFRGDTCDSDLSCYVKHRISFQEVSRNIRFSFSFQSAFSLNLF